MSIISSLVDSAVDITSGLVIWLTARAIKKHDPYMYPRGRTRLEPIALMIVQSLESVVHGTVDPHVDLISLCIMIVTVFIKFTLMFFCKKLIIVSVIMGVASVQMIVQSLESVVHGTVDPHVDLISLCIMIVTVFIKFTLMFFCKKLVFFWSKLNASILKKKKTAVTLCYVVQIL
ncbi:unnamed protein product [Gongylonema pulchrum]|uniref:Uncharacterized protein n=1 Tax=Gongylonema pulchrum TaxID=637853 RepID=A0A3P7MZ07_9BILA|nr:unnamed protein product [Gongylonema pulchrum]